MSEGLSRVKSRQKQYKGEGEPPVKGKKKNPAPEAVTAAAETQPVQPAQVAVPGTLSRKDRQSSQKTSRKQKLEAELKEGEPTPSRSQSYPSERIRFSKMFINSLYVMFLMLLVFLVWWGIEGAPPLRTLWK